MCFFEKIDCKTVEEFLQKLSLTNLDWWDVDHKCYWIFRGQNTQSNLLPSMYRESKNFSYKRIFDYVFHEALSPDQPIRDIIKNLVSGAEPKLEIESFKRLNEIIETAFIESYLIQEFVKRSNQIRQFIRSIKIFQQPYGDIVGFFQDYIPKKVPDFVKVSKFDHKHLGFFPSFLEFDFPETVALARHHGIPNRYLDWTTDPLISAFFLRMELMTISEKFMYGH